MDYFNTARTNMVKNQLLPNNINDEKVLQAMLKVQRHLFVESQSQAASYCDGRIKLSNNRTLNSPIVFARMIQALHLKGNEKVLDIACGTGYSTAVLAEIVNEVVATESIHELSHAAAYNLSNLGYNNISVKSAEFAMGASDAMPFDAIIINGAIDNVSPALFQQLKIGGRLVAIIKQSSSICKIFRYDKTKNSVDITELFDGYADQL